MTAFSNPMLKPDVGSSAVSGGVYVFHHDDGFLISNPQAATVVERLLGLLNGSRSVDVLRAALPKKVEPLFVSLVQGLEDNGMLVEGPRGLLPKGVYGTPIAAFAQMLSPDWERRLATLHDSGLSVRGRAGSVRHAVALLHERGLPAIGHHDETDQLSIEASEPDGLGVYGLFSGRRFVFGSMVREHSARWRRDVTASLGPSQQPTLIMERVGAAVACHEMMLVYLSPRDNHETGTKVARSNGSVVPFDLKAALHLQPEAQMVRSSWTAEQASSPAWLNPNGAIHRGEDVQPAFPLAHSELVISNGTGPSKTVVEWGTNPPHADARALARACEELAARRNGGTSHEYHAVQPGEAPVAAWTSLPALTAGEPTPYPLSETSYLGEVSGLLARLALIHWGELPQVRAATIDGAALVLCRLQGIDTAGIGADIDTALTEALGSAISILQTGRVPSGEEALRKVLSEGPSGAQLELEDDFPGGLRVFRA